MSEKLRMQRRKQKLYEILAAMAEVPEEVVAGIPVFVLRGRHELEISACTGILAYTAERIVLETPEGRFTVRGTMLALTDFRENVLVIRGNVESAGFGGEEDGSC